MKKIDPSETIINRADLQKIMESLAFKFNETLIEEAKISDQEFDYEIAFRTTFVNYSKNLKMNAKL